MRHERLRTAPFQADFSHSIATHLIPKKSEKFSYEIAALHKKHSYPTFDPQHSSQPDNYAQ